MRAFVERISEKELDENAALACYNRIAPYIVTDSGAEMLSEMTEKLALCDEAEFISIKGEAREKDHYMAFYVDEETLKRTVIEVFYDNAD